MRFVVVVSAVWLSVLPCSVGNLSAEIVDFTPGFVNGLLSNILAVTSTNVTFLTLPITTVFSTRDNQSHRVAADLITR